MSGFHHEGFFFFGLIVHVAITIYRTREIRDERVPDKGNYRLGYLRQGDDF